MGTDTEKIQDSILIEESFSVDAGKTSKKKLNMDRLLQDPTINEFLKLDLIYLDKLRTNDGKK